MSALDSTDYYPLRGKDDQFLPIDVVRRMLTYPLVNCRGWLLIRTAQTMRSERQLGIWRKYRAAGMGPLVRAVREFPKFSSTVYLFAVHPSLVRVTVYNKDYNC
jgi:hypothetical protein